LNISDTINEAKKELSSDEQMLASAFKLEKFYKKHKIKIYSILTIATIYVVGTAIMNNIAEQKLVTANSAYLTLEKDAKNQTALNELKTNNPALFDLYNYQEAIKNSDKEALKELSINANSIIADLSSYHLSVLEGKPAKSELYNEFALVNNASLLIKEGKIEEAKDELTLIGEDSPVFNISKMIKHYTIKGQ
jgi:hypothetical protein